MGNTFVAVSRSLADLLGAGYVEQVVSARSLLRGGEVEGLSSLAHERVEFYPERMRKELASLLDRVGQQVMEAAESHTATGAASSSFRTATRTAAAPLSARGYLRIGEDGRLYLASKSEHYHASLGHGFPGYALLDRARALGIPNATHNNTRGHVTRLLEQELIRTANGLAPGDEDGLAKVMGRTDDLRILNRVLNLETGSLAVEAALKMILARFYRIEPQMPEPKYAGRTPVILVMGSDDGELRANYHGTTVLAQMMRGMWPDLHKKMQDADIWKVVPIRPNRMEDLDRAFAEYESGDHKIAGFFHEIIMMNYGGRRLTPEFLGHAYDLCEEHDVLTMADEIQSCMWSRQLYLFREYGLRPTFVAVGKGFPGGEYPGSRILFSAAVDVMPQFGALVTNGQEELASLAYLVTMEWAQANAEAIAAMGAYYNERLAEFAGRYPAEIDGTDGWNHMTTLCFRNLDRATAFVADLKNQGLDVSAQTYKADCPPVVLTKLPLIADREVIDFVVGCMESAIEALADGEAAN
mgnify:CR=1 FL=1